MGDVVQAFERGAVEAADIPAHERVYLELRERILYGGFQPGRPVTLRGLAESLGVSPMPVREAVSTTPASSSKSSAGNQLRRRRPLSASHSVAIIDHSSRLD